MAHYDSHDEQENCIFCNIVSGEIKTPGIFWEDEHFLAMLSIDPNTEGFSVVLPKKHYGSDVMALPDDILKDFIIASKKVAKMLEQTFDDVGRVGVLMEGTGVNHAHIKLAPMHNTPELKDGGFKQYLSGKEFWFDQYEGWISSGGGPRANDDDLRILADQIQNSNS